ncbi:MAG TPA: MBOAT family O-acyltransferase, partial [Allosphingosinicella sp.]|nr:MBOAT family O-acyltransferase [Allosphingosinicella sp.]
SYFPHLVAGPILHHAEMMPQFAAGRFRPRVDDFAVGLSVFFIGLFKKVMLADQVAAYVDAPMKAATAGSVSFGDAWIGVLSYTLQIYFDFSGYSDMAIGLALMMGISFPLNFNSPYKADSLIEFWRRWHMTLSRFLRDYLYFPLGGNRKGPLRRYVNLLVTMVLGGLWHGASWNFVVWGALHGSVLAAERLWREFKPKHWGTLPAWLGTLLTFHIVVVGWVFFRAASFGDALSFLSGIARGAPDAAPMLTPMLLGLIVLGMMLHFMPRFTMQRAAMTVRAIPAAAVGLGAGVLILIVDAMRPEGVAPFIYYQF